MNIWLDVTTTLGWERPALGIVRVEAEAARQFLGVDSLDIRFCRFDKGLGSYFEVTRDDISRALERLDSGGGPGGVHSSCESKNISLLPKRNIQPFDKGDIYVSLGLDWDQKDMVFLYRTKKLLELKILMFCYDIIPIILPNHCVPGVPEKFPEFFVNVAWCANKILSISECSRKDLKDYLYSVGAPVPDLGVVRLGSNLQVNVSALPSLEIRGVVDSSYVLFVSTIESRKNHDILYRAYKKLIEAGHKDMPLLVFVGMRGWGVEDFISRLNRDNKTRPYIKILDKVSDSDLAHLYLNSLFTVYPSLYEGWGLPVAESLSCGKFCLASSAASIPEVGGDLIEYLNPLDESAWENRLFWYFKNPEAIKIRESEIVRRFHRDSWEEFGAEVLSSAEALRGDNQ